MQCPTDKTDLVMSERQGVEIDYCPKCRGVWLDRGELDKIIERSTTQVASQSPQEPSNDKEDKQGNNQEYPRKKRKESFLGDLFDF